MTDTIDLLRYDVFTDTPYTGNTLAVVVDAPPLSDEQHQRIAAELNLSETVFLRPRDRGEWDARIFTPRAELAFAGHPTIGAALALAEVASGHEEILLHEGVGPVPVEVDGGIATLRTPGAPRAVEVAEADDIAACLGLDVADLHRHLGPRGWSAGVPFTIVAVRDVETLGRIHVDLVRWRETVAATLAPELYVIAPVDELDGERWRARMFAPGLGIPEDPATGSAAAAACGYLAGHVGPSRLRQGWLIEQGVEMGRPSVIRLGAVLEGPELVAATVSGTAVQVGRGQLLLPPA